MNIGKHSNVLVIGAHPDDIEVGCGASLCKWVKNGVNVVAVVMTCENDIRRKEQENSFKVLGIDKYHIGHFIDGKMPHDKESVSFIDNLIKQHNINTIITHSEFDAHQDHHNTMKSAMSSGRLINNFLHFDTVPFRRINYQELSKPTVYSNVNDFIQCKIKSIKCHESQLSRFPIDWEEKLISEANYKGNFVNTRYAESFYCKKLYIY